MKTDVTGRRLMGIVFGPVPPHRVRRKTGPTCRRMPNACCKAVEDQLTMPQTVTIGQGADARRIAVLARAGPGTAGGVARRVQIRHALHQGGGAGRLGREGRTRLPALRLQRPWGIRGSLRRWHHLPLARGGARGDRALRLRAPDPGGILHGRLDRPAGGAAAGAGPFGPGPIGNRSHCACRGHDGAADVGAVSRGDQEKRRGHRGLSPPLRLFRGALPDHQGADRGRSAATCCSGGRSRPAARSTSCRGCRTRTCPGAMPCSWWSTCRETASP